MVFGMPFWPGRCCQSQDKWHLCPLRALHQVSSIRFWCSAGQFTLVRRFSTRARREESGESCTRRGSRPPKTEALHIPWHFLTSLDIPWPPSTPKNQLIIAHCRYPCYTLGSGHIPFWFCLFMPVPSALTQCPQILQPIFPSRATQSNALQLFRACGCVSTLCASQCVQVRSLSR